VCRREKIHCSKMSTVCNCGLTVLRNLGTGLNVLVENHISNIGLHPLGDQNNILIPLF